LDIHAHDFNFQQNETFQNAAVVNMEIPKTGKDRLMQQKQKEKLWEKNSKLETENENKKISFQDALNQRKKPNGGKGRSRKSEIKSFIFNAQTITPIDEQQVADDLVLNESVPNRKPQSGE
jgi:hypothetical protein